VRGIFAPASSGLRSWALSEKRPSPGMGRSRTSVLGARTLLRELTRGRDLDRWQARKRLATRLSAFGQSSNRLWWDRTCRGHWIGERLQRQYHFLRMLLGEQPLRTFGGTFGLGLVQPRLPDLFPRLPPAITTGHIAQRQHRIDMVLTQAAFPLLSCGFPPPVYWHSPHSPTLPLPIGYPCSRKVAYAIMERRSLR
jgi:hypothetical protein